MSRFKQFVLKSDHSVICGGGCGVHTQLMFYDGFFVEVSCKSCHLIGYSSSHAFMRELIQNSNDGKKNKSLSWGKVVSIQAEYSDIAPERWTGMISVALRGEQIPVIHYWYTNAAGKDFANVTYMPVFDAIEVIEKTEEALADARSHYKATNEPYLIKQAEEIARYNKLAKVTNERTVINTTDKLIKELNKQLR
jgi:hypothetical protein